MCGWDFLTHKLNLKGKQHGVCERRRLNPTSGQRCASPDAGRTNPTGQWPGSYSSVRKLLLIIFKSGVYWSGKKMRSIFHSNYSVEHYSFICTWFQVLLCITNNSIKHQTFVYTQLKHQIVLFQTIEFSKSHLFSFSLNIKKFYLIHR